MLDRYTKVVLTVIAVSLAWIAVALTTIPTAEANRPAASEIQAVNVVEIGGVPVDARIDVPGRSGTVPVRVVP